MTVNGDIATNAVLSLSAAAGLKDISFVQAYENKIKPTPLTNPIAAVSVKECKIGDYLTKTLNTGEVVKTNLRPVDTTLSADIYMPYSMGGIAVHRVFDRIATHLLFGGKFSITDCRCCGADYDASSQAICLRSEFVFHSTISS